MHHICRTDTRAGLTMIELVLTVVAVALLVGMLRPALVRQREVSRMTGCRNNLNQLAKGMATYISEHGCPWYSCPLGRGTKPDDHNGAEWLASLYWSGNVQDPGIYICPGSGDSNRGGADIGRHRAAATFGSQTVSYAGMHYRSLRDAQGNPIPGPIDEDYQPNVPMASDDTQGDINHGRATYGGMSILFFDGHVEFMTNTELDIEHAVGQRGGLLEQLRN